MLELFSFCMGFAVGIYSKDYLVNKYMQIKTFVGKIL